MGTFERFVIRLVLSIVFAFLISRFFFPNGPLFKVFGLALVMLGLAYFFEYRRKRDRRGGRGD
jgi:uncharacterized membrane protein